MIKFNVCTDVFRGDGVFLYGETITVETGGPDGGYVVWNGSREDAVLWAFLAGLPFFVWVDGDGVPLSPRP